MHLVSLVLVLAPPQVPAGSSADPLERVVTIEIAASDPVLAGHGPSRRVEHTAGSSGSLHVWTKVEGGLDTFLRIEDEQGKLLGQDDDSGGKPAPYLRLEVEPGRKFAVLAAASDSGSAGKVELHLVAAPETELTRAESRRAEEELAAIRKLREEKDSGAARERAEALIERLGAVEGGERSEALAQQLEAAGFETYALGSLRPTERAWRRVLAHRERTLPDGHPALQAAREELGVASEGLGDLRGARALQEKVLQIRSLTLPDDHPDLQKARTRVAMTIARLGDLRGARVLQEKVLEVLSRTRPDDDPDLQKARRNLAIMLADLGDLEGARDLEEKVLEVRSRTLPDDDPALQRARTGYASMLFGLGDLAGARALQEKVLEVRSRTLPDDDRDLQEARGNLAVTIANLGDLAGARKLFEKVLDVFSRTLPDDQAELQWARQCLASTLMGLGDPAGARALEEKVLEVLGRTLPDEHPRLQSARENLAATLSALGDRPAARALFERVLEIGSRTLPDESSELQLRRLNLAVTIAELTAERRKSKESSGEEEADRRRFAALARAHAAGLARAARIALLTASSREAEERCANLVPDVGKALSLAAGWGVFPSDPDLERVAFELSETTRGAALVSASLARRARGDDRYASLRAEMREASGEVVRLSREGGGKDALDAAIARRDAAERSLVARARELSGAGHSPVEVDPSDLAARLAEEEAWITYRRYPRWTWRPTSGVASSEVSLCAHVLRAGQDPVRVELGPIQPIEAAVASWRQSLGGGAGRGVGVPAKAGGGPDEATAGRALRKRIFDPLLPRLAGARRVVLVPDDVLHAVAFEALPAPDTGPGAGPDRVAGRGGEILGERYRFEVHTTLRELAGRDERPPEEGALVALGGADFSGPPGRADESASEPANLAVAAGQAAAASASRAPPRILRGGAWQNGFAPLPGTLEEVRGIAAEHAQDGTVVVLSGRAASRASIEELAPKARWLHLATHGWFAPESVRAWEDPEPLDKLSRLAPRSGREERIKGAGPMTLCGLALAGANLPADAVGRYPGLVTAEEISTWDLSGCELAVLSACDTNVGERRAGQGVASLQRALQMAGARSVITSLWKVPDDATRELMTDFYRRIWVEKEPKHQALWEAKKKLRDAQDERGEPRYSTRDWAAWVLTGDQD